MDCTIFIIGVWGLGITINGVWLDAWEMNGYTKTLSLTHSL